MAEYYEDEERIRRIIEDMFVAVSWSTTTPPDFKAFAKAVNKSAVVIPAARPASFTNIEAFAARMNEQYVSGAMTTFDERANKTVVNVFGNIAVAIGSFEARIDGGPVGRGANVFLFIRTEADWQIAAMAWDNEGEIKPLPADLV